MKDLNYITSPVRIRHEIQIRDVVVDRVVDLSPNIRSITFKGASLSDFVSPSFEDHIKLIIEDSNGESFRRDYTPRNYNTSLGEITLEIGIHDMGAGSCWARRVEPGDTAKIAGPRGSFIIPMQYDWHVLIGDLTALPAIHRRLDELPKDARVFARILVPAPSDQRHIQLGPRVNLEWFTQQSKLLDAVNALEIPNGEGFAWCAGEASLMSEVREILHKSKSLPTERMKIGAYWKSGDSGYHANLVSPQEGNPT